MQAKDIPDEGFLAAVKAITDRKGMWANRSEVAEELPGVPEKVILAKAKRLIERGRMEGCWCGCRGDWEIVNSKENS